MDNVLKIMVKRISVIAKELSEEKIKNALMSRDMKLIIEENDRLQTELLKVKGVV